VREKDFGERSVEILTLKLRCTFKTPNNVGMQVQFEHCGENTLPFQKLFLLCFHQLNEIHCGGGGHVLSS